MSHKTIITAIELLSCKTISENTDTTKKAHYRTTTTTKFNESTATVLSSYKWSYQHATCTDEPRHNINAGNTKEYLK